MFKVDSWQHKIEMQLQKGVWCGYKGSWDKAGSKIQYDKLLHSSTNMVNVGNPLDTQSGIVPSFNILHQILIFLGPLGPLVLAL